MLVLVLVLVLVFGMVLFRGVWVLLLLQTRLKSSSWPCVRDRRCATAVPRERDFLLYMSRSAAVLVSYVPLMSFILPCPWLGMPCDF